MAAELKDRLRLGLALRLVETEGEIALLGFGLNVRPMFVTFLWPFRGIKSYSLGVPRFSEKGVDGACLSLELLVVVLIHLAVAGEKMASIAQFMPHLGGGREYSGRRGSRGTTHGQISTLTPSPDASAASRILPAAATSCAALPTDLNSVTASEAVRPGRAPLTTSPSSA